MASDYIGLPADGVGTKVSVRALKESGVAVVRERVELATSAPVVAPASALVAAGQTVNLDSTQISTGRIARLTQILVCGQVPWHADVIIVLNGLATYITTISTGLAVPFPFRPPTPDYMKVTQSATAGFDGFRLVFTSDGTDDANVHATFFYDEEEPA